MADSRSVSRGTQKALIGAGVAAVAGAAAFLLSKKAVSSVPIEEISDAPDHVWRSGTSHHDENLTGNTVLIGCSAEKLYAGWQDFANFPNFMDNVERVETLGGKRSKWTIKAPGGSSVELVTKIIDDKPNEVIAWESEPESDISTQGRVEFIPAPPGRGTMVRLTMRYEPPGGVVGKGIAKLLQREPHIQARRDLRRFKSLMETGEVATNASPSGRKSESPTEPRI